MNISTQICNNISMNILTKTKYVIRVLMKSLKEKKCNQNVDENYENKQM